MIGQRFLVDSGQSAKRFTKYVLSCANCFDSVGSFGRSDHTYDQVSRRAQARRKHATRPLPFSSIAVGNKVSDALLCGVTLLPARVVALRVRRWAGRPGIRPRLRDDVRYVKCPEGVYAHGLGGAWQTYEWLSRLAPHLTGSVGTARGGGAHRRVPTAAIVERKRSSTSWTLGRPACAASARRTELTRSRLWVLLSEPSNGITWPSSAQARSMSLCGLPGEGR